MALVRLCRSGRIRAASFLGSAYKVPCRIRNLKELVYPLASGCPSTYGPRGILAPPQEEAEPLEAAARTFALPYTAPVDSRLRRMLAPRSCSGHIRAWSASQLPCERSEPAANPARTAN